MNAEQRKSILEQQQRDMENYLNLTHWHMRIHTPIQDIDEFAINVEDLLIGREVDKEPYFQYLLTKEEGGKYGQHYHCYFVSQQDELEIRDYIKNCLGAKGNGGYSLKIAKDATQLQKYILKDDGEYRYKNMDEDLIKKLKKVSFKKNKDKALMKDIEKKVDEYVLGSIVSKKQLSMELFKIYDSYRKLTNPQRIAERVMMADRLRNNNYDYYAEKVDFIINR